MSCDRIRDSLFDYLEGRMDPVQKLALKKHLHGCDLCSHEYEKMLKAWNALDLWEDLSPPGYLRGNILRSIKKRQRAKCLRVLVPAAAIFLIVMSLSFFLRGTDTTNHQEVTVADKTLPAVSVANIADENEDDIISNLQLLREKEFYDSLDKLQKIDYLPLVEDQQEEDDRGKQRSALELFAS